MSGPNDHYFNKLAHARAVIAEWRCDFNEARPHSALGYRTPAQVRAEWHRMEDRLTA
jgi:putative transposase